MIRNTIIAQMNTVFWICLLSLSLVNYKPLSLHLDCMLSGTLVWVSHGSHTAFVHLSP